MNTRACSAIDDHFCIGELAFKIGVTFFDHWRFDFRGLLWRQVKSLEFIKLVSRAIADADDVVEPIGGRDIDDTFYTFSAQF